MTPPPAFDLERLLADLRKGDPAAIRAAYRQVFGGQLGRMVALHIASDCKIGSVRPEHLDPMTRASLDGEANAALRILANLGLDHFNAVAMVATESLEGHDYADPDDERRRAAGAEPANPLAAD